MYSVGDTVSGALITAIMRQKVTLLVNGRKQILDMKPERLEGDGLPDKISPNFSKKFVLTRQEVQTFAGILPELKNQIKVKPI